jgi:acyl-CoA synthetase (AMP-forming)/AMP-acid ligase II
MPVDLRPARDPLTTVLTGAARLNTNPPRIGGETLGASLERIARISPDSFVTFPDTAETTITTSELRDASASLAAELAGQGVGPGELVAVLLDTTPLLLVTLFALWRLGAAATILPVGYFSSEQGTVERINAIVTSGGIRRLLVDAANLATGDRLRDRNADVAVVLVALDMAGHTAVDTWAPPAVDPDTLAYVQYTSGSTSRPKGVRLTHRNVLAGLLALVVSAEYRGDEVLVQWVPLYHDMGLFGLLSVLLDGGDSHVFTSRRFLRDPAGLLSYFGEHRGTLLTGPNFSYDYLLDAVSPERLAGLDLSSWRLAYNGAEPVSADTARRFTETLAPYGLDESVMFPVYGMAEATVGLTFTEAGRPHRVVHIDRGRLAPGDAVAMCPAGSPNSRAVVSVGRPVHGVELRVTDEHGRPVAGGIMGEIEVRGEPITDGYHNDPAATAAAFRDGWLRTGDLGFTHDGDLYVVGRSKEMIIVRGENYFPADVEEIVCDVPGVFRRRGIAFAGNRDGSEYMGVIVETAAGADTGDIGSEVRRRIAAELGLTQVEVHFVQPHWLPRTTSGKWQRLRAAERVHSGQ